MSEVHQQNSFVSIFTNCYLSNCKDLGILICVRKHVIACALCAKLKPYLFREPRKSPLNIETIEFC